MTAQEFQILQDRLDEVMQRRSLLKGAHSSLDEGMCVMEAAAYVAGRPWSDSPPCVSPVIAAFMRNWNDSLPTDADRDRLLKPLIPVLIGTKSSQGLEERRSYMALDWLVRVHTPKWLDLVPALQPHALALRDLDEIMDMAGATAAGKQTAAAGNAAWDAAGNAARAAAGNAAWDAARGAAWDAAWDAAGDHLAPTVAWLQTSAIDLVQRMCALTDEVQPYFARAS
jgi:hypothetical protein